MQRTPSQHGQVSAATTPTVVVLARECTSAARIANAFRPTTVCRVSTVEELSAAVRERATHVVAVLAEGRDARNEPVAPALTMLMAQYPDVPFLGYCGVGVSHAEEVRELARAGVHELVFRDVDDRPTLLRAKLNRGNEVRAGANVVRRLSGQLPELLHGIVAYCVGFPRESHEIERIALALGVHRKTLVNWCQRARTPPPSVLVTWVRLLLAVEMLQVPGHTVERVARGLGFASGSGFRNLCRRYCGRRPAELRCPAGREAAYRAFAKSLERRRRTTSCEGPAPVVGGPLRDAEADIRRSAPASR